MTSRWLPRNGRNGRNGRRRGRVAAAILGLGVVLAIAGAGCGSTASSSGGGTASTSANGATTGTGTGTGSGTLTIAATVPPDSLDPQASELNATWTAWSLSYDCLLRASPSGGLSPALATKWTESDGGRVYTFTLRQGVHFADGSAMTSANVVTTFERLMKTGIPYAQAQFPTLKTVTADGPYSVKFTLKAPQPGFLLNMGNPLMLACAIMGPQASAKRMDGTGPWAQTAYTPQQQLVLKRFAQYWDTANAPHFAQLKVLYMTEASSQLAALESGNVDLIFPTTSIVPSIKSASNLKLIEAPSATNLQMYINNTGPLANVDVRRAVFLAIDAAGVAQDACLGYCTPGGRLPPEYPWAPSVSEYKYGHNYNVAMAKQLLARGGYPHGLTLTFMYFTGYSADTDRLPLVAQSQLAKAGIKVVIHTYDQATWLNNLTHGQYQLSFNAHPYFSDPMGYVDLQQSVQGGPVPASVQAAFNKAEAAPTLQAYYSDLASLGLEEDNQAYALDGLDFESQFVAYRAGTLSNVEPEFTGGWQFLSQITSG